MPLPLIGLAAGAQALVPLLVRYAPSLIGHLTDDRTGETARQVIDAASRIAGTDDVAQAAATISDDPSTATAFAVEMARIAAEREKATQQAFLDQLRQENADRADARAMARAGGIIGQGAILVTVISFLLLAAILALLAYAEIPAGNREVVLMLAGTISAMAGAAAQFWVGSSSGSAGKSGLLGGPLARGRE